ncbi:MAG: hypothetical protein ACRDJM_10590 [Actinomycetota bacterium]
MDGALGPSISASGRFATFQTGTPFSPLDLNLTIDVYWKDLTTGTLKPVSVSNAGEFGDDLSTDSQVSDDGRYVVFYSQASNLTAIRSPECDFGFPATCSQVCLRDTVLERRR